MRGVRCENSLPKAALRARNPTSFVMELGPFLKGMCCLSQGLPQKEPSYMMGMLFNCCARRAVGVILFTMQCSPSCLRKNLAKPPSEGTRCYCSMDLPVGAGTGGWPGLETHLCLSLRLVRGGDGNGSS